MRDIIFHSQWCAALAMVAVQWPDFACKSEFMYGIRSAAINCYYQTLYWCKQHGQLFPIVSYLVRFIDRPLTIFSRYHPHPRFWG
jgi:hypothetical protein